MEHKATWTCLTSILAGISLQDVNMLLSTVSYSIAIIAGIITIYYKVKNEQNNRAGREGS